MVRNEMLEVGNPQWRSCLANLPHDFYHTEQYTAFAARFDAGVPAALYSRVGSATAIAPIVLRPIPGSGEEQGVIDGSSPYGYASPLFSSGADAADSRRLVKGICDAALEGGVVSLFLRLHPLLDMPLDEMAQRGTVVPHGQTVWVDLGQPLPDIESDIRSGHRYEIRRLLAAGYNVVIDDWSYFSEYVRVYRETMSRVSAADYYHFSEEYFEALRLAIAGSCHLCVVLGPDGDIAAGGMFSEYAGIVQYLFSGTSQVHARKAPSKLMIHHMIGWAHSRRNSALHLGGGLAGKEDSLFNFKAGFSPRRSTFYSWRVILDSSRYGRLVDARQRAVGGSLAEHYFPEYRAPAAPGLSCGP